MGDFKSSVYPDLELPVAWQFYDDILGGDNVHNLWILRPANAPLIFIYDTELIFMKREEECLLRN